MKRILIALLAVCTVAAAFAACSKDSKNTTFENGGIAPPAVVTTNSAKIKDNEAIALIKSYSAEELSLTEEQMKECDFGVNTNGVEIDGDYYIFVSAGIKKALKDDPTKYTREVLGEYYIRYDGKQILKKDMSKDKDEYSELKIKDKKD